MGEVLIKDKVEKGEVVRVLGRKQSSSTKEG
jgi:hypothetical protein